MTEPAVVSVRGLRPSSQCSLLTLWRRGIAERSGRALDAVPPVRVRAVGFDGHGVLEVRASGDVDTTRA